MDKGKKKGGQNQTNKVKEGDRGKLSSKMKADEKMTLCVHACALQ